MKRNWKAFARNVLLASSLGMVGCHSMNSCDSGRCRNGPLATVGRGDSNRWDRCATVTPGSLPEPNGTYVRRYQQIQANLAEQDDFVFYLHNWRELQLTPEGEYRLLSMARRLSEPDLKFPVVVQISNDPLLNENRRRIIIDRLTELGVPGAINRVHIGYPEAEGIDARESFRIEAGALGQSPLSNFFGGGAGGLNFGGFGGGGFGGGGFGGFGGFGGGGFGGGFFP